MPRNYQKTKKSFIKDSNDPFDVPSRSKKVPCHCNKCKGQMVDLRTKKSHDLKRDIGLREIIEDIPMDLNRDLFNESPKTRR